jgi:hypothetical protein
VPPALACVCSVNDWTLGLLYRVHSSSSIWLQAAGMYKVRPHFDAAAASCGSVCAHAWLEVDHVLCRLCYVLRVGWGPKLQRSSHKHAVGRQCAGQGSQDVWQARWCVCCCSNTLDKASFAGKAMLSLTSTFPDSLQACRQCILKAIVLCRLGRYPCLSLTACDPAVLCYVAWQFLHELLTCFAVVLLTCSAVVLLHGLSVPAVSRRLRCRVSRTSTCLAS